ncbi:hypothetical protein [Streptomyces sp. NPDC089919]|uniref:hypothetical protein n=1 Tax=Streptomyces sp. NPDC089919 TaxID=3155188 RepID=UPI003427D626
MSRSSAALTTAAVVVGLGFVAAVAVPAAADWYDKRHDESATYATGAAAKSERASVPGWLPDGATGVRYAMKTTGGDRLLKAALPEERLPAQCRPTPRAATGAAPALAASWFPQGAGPRATARCGSYYVYLDGHTLYGWQHNADWIAENKTRAAG